MRKFVFTSLIFLTLAAGAKQPDRYKDFADLARHEQEGVAYHVDVLDRHAQVTVIAIHGGKIEDGSNQLAREIAGTDLNLYTFVATLPKDNHRLHVTSTHFDDPRALALVRPAKYVISIHGFKETKKDRVCVGGANAELRDHLVAALKASDLGIEIESPCLEFGGSEAKNIVNLGKNPGLQLELSTHLRDRLIDDTNLKQHLAKVIRSGAL